MLIQLSLNGEAIQDCRVIDYVKEHIDNCYQIITSNELVIRACRAYLKSIPANERPDITWIIYGQPVRLDTYMNYIDVPTNQFFYLEDMLNHQL